MPRGSTARLSSSGGEQESSVRLPEQKVRAVQAAVLAWYRQGHRDLPWRRTRDPYAILVSEVMLQQTQVERVLPRYVAWLERWPTAKALAAAPVRDVLPVDTNVARIRERTGAEFDGSCAQALMDLGATICLGRVPRCDVCPLA